MAESNAALWILTFFIGSIDAGDLYTNHTVFESERACTEVRDVVKNYVKPTQGIPTCTLNPGWRPQILDDIFKIDGAYYRVEQIHPTRKEMEKARIELEQKWIEEHRN